MFSQSAMSDWTSRYPSGHSGKENFSDVPTAFMIFWSLSITKFPGKGLRAAGAAQFFVFSEVQSVQRGGGANVYAYFLFQTNLS